MFAAAQEAHYTFINHIKFVSTPRAEAVRLGPRGIPCIHLVIQMPRFGFDFTRNTSDHHHHGVCCSSND